MQRKGEKLEDWATEVKQFLRARILLSDKACHTSASGSAIRLIVEKQGLPVLRFGQATIVQSGLSKPRSSCVPGSLANAACAVPYHPYMQHCMAESFRVYSWATHL